MSKPFRKPVPIPNTTAAEAFIQGANDEPAAPHRRATDYPWDGANPKYRLNFQARTPEPLYLKIKWLAERHANNHNSMQEIVQTAVERYVAELLHAELEKDRA